MFRRGRNPLFAAKDVGHAHQMVVDDVGQVVGRKSVGLLQHLVVHLFGAELQFFAQVVDERHHDGLG